MNEFFRFEERGTNLRTELSAGVTTFLTMAYIIFVNPGILSAAGVPFAGAATATALGAALMCICMGLVTNRPLALASGMGLNAVIAFSVIGFQQANVPWQVGMSVIFLEGVLILILVLSGLREAVMNAIPLDLKRAIGVGIGLFITIIGLNGGGIIRPAPFTLVALGDLSQKYVWVSFIGLFAVLIFRTIGIRSHILFGILAATLAALFLGVAKPPSGIVGPLDFQTFFGPFQKVGGTYAVLQVFTPALLVMVFAVLLTDFFDTMGTVVAVGEQAGFVDREGRIPGIRGILTVDSAAAVTGGLFGASSITTYVESAAGVAEGGRTGLTAVVVGILFAFAAFFSPIIQMVGGGFAIPSAQQYGLLVGTGATVPAGDYHLYPITAGALIVVGFLMMGIVREIQWSSFEEAFPAFLIMVGIPLTYNISYGIGFGFISYTLLKIVRGRYRDVPPLLYVISAVFLIAFALPFV
ncbi:MAG: NCS2 family permease [Deltaproteobacteria bacterium HGW-Deltaproteobacteria-19]|jgi:AGZA family xanthine/uracil permease-like MFS transporter|nr:MAG: NCS2 family permease [Deltaproteobacteria bacterium HGW-Deltaproteobacteria-19]